MTKRKIVIGDVYYFQFEGVGCEQSGIRPAVIIQNNKGNEFSPNLIVLPLTTKLKHIARRPMYCLNLAQTEFREIVWFCVRILSAYQKIG